MRFLIIIFSWIGRERGTIECNTVQKLAGYFRERASRVFLSRQPSGKEFILDRDGWSKRRASSAVIYPRYFTYRAFNLLCIHSNIPSKRGQACVFHGLDVPDMYVCVRTAYALSDILRCRTPTPLSSMDGSKQEHATLPNPRLNHSATPSSPPPPPPHRHLHRPHPHVPPSPSVSASRPSCTPSPSRPPTSRHSRTPHQPLHTNFHSPLTTQPSTPTSHPSRCPPCRSDQPTKKRTDERGGKKARRKGKERKGKERTYSNLLPQKLHILLAPAQRRPRRVQLLPQQRLGVRDGVRQHDVRA